MMKSGKSIGIRFIAVLLVVLLFGQGVMTFIFIKHTRAVILDSLNDRIKMIGGLLSGVSTGPLLSYDYALIDVYLEEASRDDEITAIKVLDKDGKPVREKVKEGGAAKDVSFLKLPVSVGKEILGYVAIFYTTQAVDKSVKRSAWNILVSQSIMLVIVVIVIAVFFSVNIRKPVSGITGAIEKITAGDLTATARIYRDDEIGSIARGVLFLAAKLSESIARLNSTAENVFMAINQLNRTFRGVIDGTKKQAEATQAVSVSTKEANKSQKQITEDTEKLIAFSNENVTSLLEMKASADEIVLSADKLFKATEDAYSIVAEMSQTAKVIAANTEEAFSAVEDTSTSVEEINASVKEVEVNAKESASLALRVTEVASKVGMVAVKDSIEGMEKISEEVKRSSDIITHLGARSADIERILKVIKDVTEQTNLLSLNAAILAAQAGEYGKSFSVVADEIRALSDRTASSTRDIANIVNTIQVDIADAVKAIDSTMNRVEEGSAMVARVGSALEETLSVSKQSTEMSRSIEKATEEQSKGLRQVANLIENLHRMIGFIAKATQEQQTGTAHLLGSVSDVKDTSGVVKQGATEEAATIRMISKNLELADDRIKQIGHSTVNQQKGNESIAAAMEQIRIIGMSTISDVEGISISLKTLCDEIESLKKEMGIFKTGKIDTGGREE